ncbi:hypothetical protein [Cohaesibacter gelatinilyticus]|uniref:Uncharacterized protein n=1 Tax=Cohaesibacter gelatinilyticus TaxID=372072 RepID=A0A285PEC4_9HYPH|nr:hypothetical protein [Cohaesibacter gelatinilyticus]SNZ20072.1 hypothetical protein SAMN06265368_3171 [Cohaesibacter gelatinilyticus]
MMLTRYFLCAISLSALISPTEVGAGDNVGSHRIERTTDCVAFVKKQRALAAENGEVMSRRDQKLILLDCRNGELEDHIAKQERILSALDEQIRQQNFRLEAQGRIIDDQGQELARVIWVNRKLVLRRETAEVEQAQILDEIEAYLVENSF